jgi:Ca2+-binding EF-hand superfamily protein
MRAASLLMFAMLAAALALSACGSDTPKQHRWYPNGGPPRNEDWHSPVAMLLKYDANRDGTLTRQELEAGLRAEFDAADKNHTGCLDPAEVREINEQRVKLDESAASPLIDWKNNGCIDFDEFATTARSLFEQLDKKGDGKLTPEMLHPKKNNRREPTERAPGENPNGGGY